MAPGENIVSYNDQNGWGWCEGTSFTTPVALSGAAALAKQYNYDLTPDEIYSLMSLTATPVSTNIETADNECPEDKCGYGLLQASDFMDKVIDYSEGKIFTFKSALSDSTECGQELYATALGGSSRLCSLYTVTLDA